MNRVIGVGLGAILIAALAGTGGLTGCAASDTRRVPIEGVETATVGPLALDIQNQLGEVQVVVEPGLAQPYVEAIPFSEERPIGQVDRAAALKPWVAAQVSEAEPGGRVLRVLCTAAENQPVRPVYLNVRVPRCDGVRVKNVGGPVTLTGVGGAVEVNCTPSTPTIWQEGAAVRVRTDRALTSGVTISSTDGEVVLILPRTSSGSIEALSPDTVVSLAQVAGAQNMGDTRTDVRGTYFGSLNNGEAAINLKSGKRIRMTTTTEPPVFETRRVEAGSEPTAPAE